MSDVDTAGLTPVTDFPFPMYASIGAEARARTVGERAARALGWLSAALGTERHPVLFVVGPTDWPQFATMPLYGMPHARAGKVVVGTEPASFWNEIPAWFWPHLTDATRDRLLQAYGDPPDLASRLPDLIVVHELVHLYQGNATFPRPWLGELFANLGFHGYLAEVEPQALSVVEPIYDAAAEVPVSVTPVRALDDMYRSFEYEHGGVLYGWYQLMLSRGAMRIWDAVGIDGFRAYAGRLQAPEMTDGEIMAALESVHPEAALLMRTWPA